MVLGYELWQRHFGGTPDAIGKTITIDTFGLRDFTVVGVLQPGFRFPDESELWLPAGWNGLPSDRRQGHWLTVLARLKPGVTLEAAQTEMNAIQAGIASQFPSVVIGTHVAIVPLLERTLVPKLRAALFVLWAIVACVLLIACANVANLSLASAEVRQREIAIRLALGASRLRVARQMMTESLMLALAGGIIGSLLGVLILRLIVAFNAGHVPRLDQVRIDPLMLLFTAGVTLGTGFLLLLLSLSPP